MSLIKYSISVESFKNLDQLHKLRRNFLHFISDSLLYKIYCVHYYTQDAVIENFYFPFKMIMIQSENLHLYFSIFELLKYKLQLLKGPFRPCRTEDCPT